jgi:putative hemolysin
LMSPFSGLLAKITTSYTRPLSYSKHELSMEDLSKALEITSDEITRDQEKEMLEGIIRFRDKSVDDIKISRSDMIAINIQTLFVDVIDFIVEAGFSRIPVYEDNPDNIKGILYVKDLLPHLGKPHNFKWQSLIRSAYFVPGAKRIDDLLEEFRSNKIHMAIVVDEYGGTSGLVTMEDILEEIVGDISDEYDEELPLYTIAADGTYIFEGKTPLEDFIKITNVPEKDFEAMSDEVDTLAGLLLELKGDFPKRKETFTYKKYTFQAEEMSKKRIIKVRYIPPKLKTKEVE